MAILLLMFPCRLQDVAWLLLLALEGLVMAILLVMFPCRLPDVAWFLLLAGYRPGCPYGTAFEVPALTLDRKKFLTSRKELRDQVRLVSGETVAEIRKVLPILP